MISIRKLVAVDMALHGARFILAECALGVILPLVLGLLSVRAGTINLARLGWETALGFWLVGAAANYVPLLIYAILITRGRTIQAEGGPELARVKRYSVQQVIILVPFLVVVVALIQERANHRQLQ